jgi:hypothetical protein
MKMLSDKEILEVKSPQKRTCGKCVHGGPWFVLQKTPVGNCVEAYVLLEWQEERGSPIERRIGKRLFEEDGVGKPANFGIPYWQIIEPNEVNALPLDKRLKTIAEDFLGGREGSLSISCLGTLSYLKQTLDLAGYDAEQNIGICYYLYQKIKRWSHEKQEKEMRAIDEELDRITVEAGGKPDSQKLSAFLSTGEYFLPSVEG